MNKETQNIEDTIELINSLTYDVMMLESQLDGCENIDLGMDLMTELIEARFQLALHKDITGL